MRKSRGKRNLLSIPGLHLFAPLATPSHDRAQDSPDCEGVLDLAALFSRFDLLHIVVIRAGKRGPGH